MDPNTFDVFRRNQVYPFIRGSISGWEFDCFRRGQPLPNLDSATTSTPSTYIQHLAEAI